MKVYHCNALISEMLQGRISGSNQRRLNQWVLNKPCRINHVREICWIEILMLATLRPNPIPGREDLNTAGQMLRIANAFFEKHRAIHPIPKIWIERYKELEIEVRIAGQILAISSTGRI